MWGRYEVSEAVNGARRLRFARRGEAIAVKARAQVCELIELVEAFRGQRAVEGPVYLCGLVEVRKLC